VIEAKLHRIIIAFKIIRAELLSLAPLFEKQSLN